MNIDMTGAIEQIRKSRDSFSAFLDKLSHDKKIFEKNNENKADTEELMENLIKARNELIIATTNYEFAKDNDLIDYYAYLIKAAQIKYDYLLKKVKEKEMELGREFSINSNPGRIQNL